MLSSFLLSRPGLAAPGKLDDSLDAIFAASAKPATVIKLPADGEPSSNTRESHPPVSTKRKRKQERSEDTSHSSKRQKDKDVTMGLENLQLQRPKDLSKHHRSFKDVEALTEDRGGEPSAQTASTNDKDEPPTKRRKKVSNGVHLSMSPEQTDGESDDDTEDRPIVHESISGQTLDAGTARKTAHYAPEGETPAQREERTIFIGNLPTEILTKKSMQKGLKRHLLSCIPPPHEPTTKIESIRFRSVAFKAPTNPLALRDGEAKPKSKPRNLERASAWKSVQKGEGLFAEGTKPKEHLTPAEKKRIAFIKGEFHEQGDSVNAFVVFAHQDSTKQVRDTWMDPSDAAAFVVEKMNRSRFEGRTLRVDRVGQSAKIATKDTTKTIFVGNLDFAAKEEQLRIFFETLLTSEIGPATGDGGDDSQSSEPEDGHGSAAQRPRWVHDVRIIRDEGTQLGKGFAYVRFSERTCVDEVLAMEPTKLKFTKRKLRVTRYNNKGSGLASAKTEPKHSSKGLAKTSSMTNKESAATTIKHHGDPLLGDRLKGLSKEERKDAKKNDANRLARRLEKKKARLELEKSLAKPAKDRVRVRKLKAISGAKGSRKPSKRTQL